MKLYSNNISHQKRVENEFLKEGYTINKIENTHDLKWIKDQYLKIICDEIKIKNRHGLENDFFNKTLQLFKSYEYLISKRCNTNVDDCIMACFDLDYKIMDCEN